MRAPLPLGVLALALCAPVLAPSAAAACTEVDGDPYAFTRVCESQQPGRHTRTVTLHLPLPAVAPFTQPHYLLFHVDLVSGTSCPAGCGQSNQLTVTSASDSGNATLDQFWLRATTFKDATGRDCRLWTEGADRRTLDTPCSWTPGALP